MSPRVILDRESRRAVQLAVLSGRPALEVAEKYGISRQRVYELRDEARENAAEELAHWRQVAGLLNGSEDCAPGLRR